MKKHFSRGLEQKAFEEVKSFLRHTKVGNEILSRDDLDICIRDNSINVYKSGCSILKYSPLENKYTVHKKYLGITIENKKYYQALKLVDGDLIIPDSDISFIENILNKPNELLCEKSSLSKNECAEKVLMSKYIRESCDREFLVDLEIAYSKKDQNKKRAYAERIDMACIDPMRNKLCFIEVKVSSDDRVRLNQLKSESGEIKIGFEVIRQIIGYADFIKRENADGCKYILNSYKNIARNIIDLDLSSRRYSRSCENDRKVLERFSSEGIVDETPYLLVLETDAKNVNKYGDNVSELSKMFYSDQLVNGGHLFSGLKQQYEDEYRKFYRI